MRTLQEQNPDENSGEMQPQIVKQTHTVHQPHHIIAMLSTFSRQMAALCQPHSSCSRPAINRVLARGLASTAIKHQLPARLIDAHHYYFDPAHNPFNAFLGSARTPPSTPEQYKCDVIDTLWRNKGVKVEGSVHVEMTDDGPAEVEWIQGLIDSGRADDVRAIVAYADLSSPDAEEKIVQAKAKSDKVKGVRVILDHGGGADALSTHLAFKPMRLPNRDHLKLDAYGDISPAFEKGIDLLSKYNLTFDALAAPAQLPKLAKLFKWHTDVPFCIDHMGKPRPFLSTPGFEHASGKPSRHELSLWRQGMQSIADLPNSFVKLSMLGYAVPGWFGNPAKEQLLQELVLETVDRFGPERCMVGTNHHIDKGNSDSDGLENETEAPDVATLVDKMSQWFDGYLSQEEQDQIFYATAKRFYGI